jgi:ABC-type glycerol-3-phosphate transport system substrate-binding protein
MVRLLLIAAAVAGLTACASGPEGNAWYQLGDANYDALKAAADACKAKGGDFQLKTGGEPTHLGDYACNPKKGS